MMPSIFKSQFFSYLLELGKWGGIIWLLWPLSGVVAGTIAFARVALGIALFVIFIGKLLYDVVFFPRQHAAESSPGKDLISMIGIVLGIAGLVALLVFFVALLVINYMSASTRVQ